MGVYHDDMIPVQVIATVWIRQGANVQEVVSEMDYEFKHEDILDSEIREINTDI